MPLNCIAIAIHICVDFAKEIVERSFADAKQQHGHRYAWFRGLSKVQMQCLLAATVQNMKKMALLAASFGRKKRRTPPEKVGVSQQSAAGLLK